MNCNTLCETAGIKSVGFLTLTVGDSKIDLNGEKHFVQVWDAAEASRRINNLARHVLPAIFTCAVLVSERHQSGAIHFHLLGALVGSPDIHTGFNHRCINNPEQKSNACPALRSLWAYLNEVLPKYGFGISQLTPVRKTAGHVASYVSKYIEKNICNRHPADKGKKLVRYHGFNKQHLKPNDFEWNTPAAKAWRSRACEALKKINVTLTDKKVVTAPHVTAAVCHEASQGRIRAKCLDTAQAASVLGPRWAFFLTHLIEKLELADGDKLKVGYLENNILSCELQRQAGRSWCKESDKTLDPVYFLGEQKTGVAWRKIFNASRNRQTAKKL
jgi:hypothetical protein